MAILPTREPERVGTAREILPGRNLWRGAPLPTLQPELMSAGCLPRAQPVYAQLEREQSSRLG
jgi:hypothetical protein